ncbi:YbhB/YbcL family Raf kinase inhibitor-like protein [Streptomyces lonarensis]|uniref:YbhB/YbcL family Raf kinase inhibitor-like protein n=1 Tax=Streptomyces lonarensis TaxID=700599 RepID=A0A7X6HZ75_9ACTN|nr:YbhB/YbcL family Raf kinase inhibitor-like protein [Streptomyces lonarensis]NJQ05939.1 YbhB/YbcL family Raf kinase inhibitor-like protein [Streptomyces lonarensis]
MTESRRPLPHAFHPPVESFTLISDDVLDGMAIKDDQVKAKGDTSPHLRWAGAPEGTKSYAVTCFDPDAPTGSGYWHWSAFDIPAGVTELQRNAGAPGHGGMPSGSVQVRNDGGSHGFEGAAPPPGDGEHRYVFTVYAVDTEHLGLDRDATPAQVGFMLRFHAIGRAQLIGTHEVASQG